MGEEILSRVNFDLNLGFGFEVMNVFVWGNGLLNGEFEFLRRFWLSLRQVDVCQVFFGEIYSLLIELSQLIIFFVLLVGEEEFKKCENGNKVVEEENVREEKRVVEKSVGSEGSFFDCYVCLDLFKELVVINCGYFFCWFCFYRWLQVLEVKECLVCKGEVLVKILILIYGCGEKNKRVFGEGGLDKNKKILLRF